MPRYKEKRFFPFPAVHFHSSLSSIWVEKRVLWEL
jgi:hypothetical protein